MNIYTFSIWWRYSSDNFAHGIIKANSEEEAKEKLKESYKNSHYIGMDIHEIVWDSYDACIIYER